MYFKILSSNCIFVRKMYLEMTHPIEWYSWYFDHKYLSDTDENFKSFIYLIVLLIREEKIIL